MSLNSLFLTPSEIAFQFSSLGFEFNHSNLELRLKNKVTQSFVAKRLNTSQSAYSHYENALNVIPTSFIYGLTKIYKPFSIDELFGRKKVNK